MCARTRASCACGREEHARASGASERSAHAAKKVRHGAASANVARQQHCEAVWLRLRRRLCCELDFACRQIRQSLARQVPLGAAEKVSRLVSAQWACLVGQRVRRQWASARRPVCQRLPSGRVAQARGFPHRSGERTKSAAVWLLARRSRQPRCEGVWPRLRAGLCCKSARACREIRHGSAQQVPSGEAKKVSHGVPAHRAWTVASGWSNNGLVSAVGRGILLSSSAKKVHHCPAFLPSCLIHNPVFSSSAGSSPMQWANICAQGTG